MKIAFVADPLDGLDPSIDTTVGLMHAAQNRGAEVWVTQARLLEAAHGRARGHARRVRVAPSQPRGDHRWTVARRWFTAGEPQRVWLDEMAAIFMRTEPPLDQAYLTATLILDLVDPGRTALVNDPGGLDAPRGRQRDLQLLERPGHSQVRRAGQVRPAAIAGSRRAVIHDLIGLGPAHRRARRPGLLPALAAAASARFPPR